MAGGRGERMGGDTPKQFLALLGKPVLVHTVQRFQRALPDARIVVAVPPGYPKTWRTVARAHGLRADACEGGESRFASVRNALHALGPCEYVMVHDGVRPLVSEALINRMLGAATHSGAAIPVTKPVDSYRVAGDDGASEPIDRRTLRAVQTPQVFRYDILTAAYARPFDPSFTDDASVIESAGFGIDLEEGDPMNIKITTPVDLELVQFLMGKGC